MHELYGATGDAVARIVPELHKRGFQMVTVSQMAAAKGRSLRQESCIPVLTKGQKMRSGIL